MGILSLADSHCHLSYINEKGHDIEQVLSEARSYGLKFIMDVGVHPCDIDERVKSFSGIEDVCLSAGFYPDYASEYKSEELDDFEKKIEELNAQEKVIKAVGEVGLDYYHNGENKNDQMDFFARLIQTAKRQGLPVIVHTRDAFEDCFSVLESGKPENGGVFHCFSGGVQEARRALDLGFYISFAGNITYKKSAELREAAAFIPEDRLLIETDAPYLAPKPYRGKENFPKYIERTFSIIAEGRGIDSDDEGALSRLSERILENTRAVFNVAN